MSVVGLVSARVAGPKHSVFFLFNPGARHKRANPKIAAGKIAALHGFRARVESSLAPWTGVSSEDSQLC